MSEVRRLLERCLGGRELEWREALPLLGAEGGDLDALVRAADALRAEQVGDRVTYVVNRNINFTNACTKACRFCAFSRAARSGEAYFLPEEEVVARAVEAARLGATEVCIQAGLAPGIDGGLYVRLVRAIKAAAPGLHLHAFSPEEVKYGAGLLGVPVRAFLEELRDAGLGSLPGTSAEILDDDLRAVLAPGRITTAEWVDVITTAHALGIPTTSTLMFGHVETPEHVMRHLDLLRRLQRDTGGFTELVPLSFVHAEAPMFLRGLMPGLRPGPTPAEVLRVHAVARVFLGRAIPNLQASWVKLGLEPAAALLAAGANDLGGTLMNESISTAAGAGHGQFQPPAALRRAIRGAGRRPAERDTRYRLRDGGDADRPHPLDAVTDAAAAFGTYRALVADPAVRLRR